MAPTLTLIANFIIALILHEFGHWIAARICRVPITAVGLGWGPALLRTRLVNTDCQLGILPFGAFVRMDMDVFRRRSVNQQLLVLTAGVGVNLLLAILTWGSLFSILNLGLAIGNSLPLYQQDGWKSCIVLCRRVLGRTSPVVEWTITLTGGVIALAVVARALMVMAKG